MNIPAKRSRILIVDDELGPREALRMILRDDYEVVTADCGKRALEHLEDSDFDLAILDIRMPDMNGVELLGEIKKRAPETEVVMITAYASVDTATNALRNGALDYLIKPFDCSAVKEVVEKGLLRRTSRISLRNRLNELEVTASSLKEEIERAYNTIQKYYLETVRSLVAAIDAKDSYTKGHQERVVLYAKILGKELGLTADEMQLLQQAAILHDIGKIGVPEQILRKPAPLSAEEFNIIKQHPVTGAEIISPVEFLKNAVPIVLCHHEKFNGRGYPRGIKGQQIPICARIIAVADAIDAMLSERPYAPVRTAEQVREELILCSGTQFDPEIVAAALRSDLPARRIDLTAL